MPDSKGAQQNQQRDHKKGGHKHYLKHIWGRDKDPFPLNAQEFKFTIVRPDRTNFNIGPLIESAEWRDEGNFNNINAIPVLRGTITLRKPSADDPHHAGVVIHDGYVVRCKIRWGANWHDLWEMRIQQTTVGVGDGSWTLECADDFQLASKSSYDYKFKSNDHGHKQGWRYWEIVQHVCHHAKIPFDHKMPKGHKWIKNFNQTKISPLEAIRQVVQQEQDYTGRPFVISWRNGKLRIRHLRRNRLLFTLSKQLRDASVQVQRGGQVVTSLTGIGHLKAKKGNKDKTKKLRYHVSDHDAVKKYGFIHIEHNFGEVNNHEQLKHLTKRYYAKNLKAVRKITGITHYGIAFIRRGDAIRLKIPQEGIKGERSILFVYNVTHSLSGGDYSMSCDVTQIDPLDPETLKNEREKAKRRRKHGQKGKGNNDKKQTPDQRTEASLTGDTAPMALAAQSTTYTAPTGGYVPVTGLVSSGRTDKPWVSITYDTCNGGIGANTDEIIQTFHRHKMLGTVNVVGQQVVLDPGAARRIINSGMEIGNHSWSHPDLVAESDKGYDEYRKCQFAVAVKTGFTPCLCRPPGGHTDAGVIQAATKNKLVSVKWGHSPSIFDTDPSSVAATALDGIVPGQIVLLHANDWDIAALDAILSGLTDRGLRSVPVTRLLGGHFRYPAQQAPAFTETVTGPWVDPANISTETG